MRARGESCGEVDRSRGPHVRGRRRGTAPSCPRVTIFAGAVGAVVAVLAMTACSGSATPPPLGTLADSGFRPAANGFPFANYGATLENGAAPTNLTVADVRAMFGDKEVCADAASGRCDLIPEAQAWLDDTNKGMAGGHCYGFSVLAQLLWEGKVNHAALGAPSTTALSVNNNEALQRAIAYYWSFQLLGSVGSKAVRGTPNQVLATLRKVLKPHPTDTYTVAIFKPDFSAGHAVTPYAVENEGSGKFKVLIYDNNWPGATRAISFDTKANSWTYAASTNPDDPESTYSGNAKTKSMTLLPTSPGLGDQPCPFCGKVPDGPTLGGGLGVKGTDEITLTGSDTDHADLVIADHSGHRLGDVNGALVDHISGARVEPLISGDWSDNIEPDFVVPAHATYTVTIDGSRLRSPDTETLRLIGPGYDVAVDNIPVRPGDRDTLVVAPGATTVSYTSSRAESPTIELGVSDTRADYTFTVAGVSDRPGSTINLRLPAEGGTLTFDNMGSAGRSTVDLKVVRETPRGVQVFSHDGVGLAGGDKAELEFGHWANPTEGMALVTTHAGQRSAQTLADQQGA